MFIENSAAGQLRRFCEKNRGFIEECYAKLVPEGKKLGYTKAIDAQVLEMVKARSDVLFKNMTLAAFKAFRLGSLGLKGFSYVKKESCLPPKNNQTYGKKLLHDELKKLNHNQSKVIHYNGCAYILHKGDNKQYISKVVYDSFILHTIHPVSEKAYDDYTLREIIEMKKKIYTKVWIHGDSLMYLMDYEAYKGYIAKLKELGLPYEEL